MDIMCISAEVLLEDLGPGSIRDTVEILGEIEVIFGRDILTQEVFLIDGRDRLKAILRDRNSPPVDVLIVELDRSAVEFDRILSLVRLAKSKCDYLGPGFSSKHTFAQISAG